MRADGSTSTDGDATPIASYRFDFGDNTPPVTTTAPTAIAQHSYAAGGAYTISGSWSGGVLTANAVKPAATAISFVP